MESHLTSSQFTQRMVQESMIYHYGERLFKCRYVNCSFRRHGFNSKASRRSHEKEHEKPWKCDVEGCEFEKGGFLSRKMRDEHLEQFHNHDDIIPNGAFGELDENDLEYVCLDLVKANDVRKIRELAAAGMLENKSYLSDLVACAAQYASPEIMKILLGQGSVDGDVAYHESLSRFLMPEIVAGNNSKMLEYILQINIEDWMNYTRKKDPTGYYLRNKRWFEEGRTSTLSMVLGEGSDEMLRIFCKWVEQDPYNKNTGIYLIHSSMIAATARDIYREHILLGLWRKIPSQRWSETYWKNAMLHVASTTCSIELARFLVDQEVPVDWRNNSKASPTPLVYAARKTDDRAAQLVRFLLFNGAETVVEIEKRNNRAKNIVKYRIDVSAQKGAQQISKWLGVTFDELVAEAKKARGGGRRIWTRER
jgi:hypothetical protein